MEELKLRRILTVMATTLVMAVFALMNTACVGSGKGLHVEGRLLSMNQADFYVYSPDGIIDGIDTIHVQGGRFTYDKPTMARGIIVLVLPNFMRIPLFVNEGASIDIDGNAANLKEIEITGTEENDLFTTWRKNSNALSPPEMKRHAEHFISDHPGSDAARWLLLQHFITCTKPDLDAARRLLGLMSRADAGNPHTVRLIAKLKQQGSALTGSKMPKLTATTIDGTSISSNELSKGKTLIMLWSSWNYESQNMLRTIASRLRKEEQEQQYDHVLTICLDADVKLCRRTMKANSFEELPTVCDGLMWDSPLIKTLGLASVPDNLKYEEGKLTAHSLPTNKLFK